MRAISDTVCIFFRSITRDDLVEYVNKHYSAPRIVLAAAGGMSKDNK